MPDLENKPGELHFTLEITRAATGITETVEMVGHVIHDEEPIVEQPTQE